MSTKPVVKFGRFSGFTQRRDEGYGAMLDEVDGHPRLGHCDWVRTSPILAVEYRDAANNDFTITAIETLNTRYERK